MKKHFTLFAMLFLVATSLIGGLVGRKVSADASQDEKDVLYRKYALVLSTIQKNAADIPNDAELIYNSVREMLRGMDPHSSFFSPKDYKELEEDNSGRYYGLGIRIRALTRGSGRIVIIEPPFPGTPAAKVGLQAGDVIFKVNGESIDDWDTDDVIDHLKGAKGTQVHITVLRPGEADPLEIDVLRDEIPKLTINYSYRIRPAIGYIKIEHFSETTHKELVEAMERLSVDSLEGLIIDLRDNPGGYLTQAIKVSEEFLPQGAPVVTTRGRDSKDEQRYSTRESGNLTVPLVVLINTSSASASEIVAGAIQDNDRGLIVGERSFGKGLVQSVYRLGDGSGLALTTGKYYAPSGRCLQRPYNGSIYDYYNPRLRKAVKVPEDEVKYTLSHRKVYGGGGIQPDVEYKARTLNRFELTLYSKDVFFKFANLAMQGKMASVPKFSEEQKDAARQFEVNDAVLKDFREFLSGMKVNVSEEDFTQNAGFIRRGIKAEIFTRVFGILDGFKIRAEGDDQIAKAEDVIPQARSMLVKTKEILANIKDRKDKGGL
ncbi:MAG: Carboxyl-terminal protease [candidate division NC10 bacterium]|jgi:carboxyl-terminal processing protease|nr:Carboxyl-terminal protease [candidate division NC10 bacterium]